MTTSEAGNPLIAPPEEVVKRRLLSIAVSGFATSFAMSGLLVILPLYATSALKLSNAQFARVLSLRMTGIAVGVVMLGALGDHFGMRRVSATCLACGGLGFSMLAFMPLTGFLIAIPIVSALLSTSFVNLNTLTQLVQTERQGRANTVYRAVGAAGAIAGPFAYTQIVGKSAVYWPAFVLGGLILCIGAIFLSRYPIDEPRQSLMEWRTAMRALAKLYSSALRERHAMVVMNILLLISALGTVMITFAAIRMTGELQSTPEYYGNACSIGALLGLIGIVALGTILDRTSVKWCVMVMSAGCALSLIGMGLSVSAFSTATWFVAFSVLQVVSVAPAFIWMSRESGTAGMNATFAIHKVLMGLYNAIVMFVFGWLEPAFGISVLFLVCGLMHVPVLMLLALTREPQASLAPNTAKNV